ncbi:MAG TPA: hydroxyacid dehydrogenase [Aggregatilineales bacterium]|nr:hydroxyacid dehydrogenase [Aggregatilineales bacterium]
MAFHILIPDNLDKAGLNILSGTEGVTIQAAAKMSRDEVIAAIPNADGLIIRSATKVDRAMLEAAPKLRLVGRAGVGVDNVDLAAATDKGVVVMNAPDGNTIATAELAFGLMLSLARKIPAAQASMQAGEWDRKSFTGSELRGKTLGIIGFGRVGRAIAKRAQAFEMAVITYDPYVTADMVRAAHVIPVALDDLYANSDYITLHAVVSDENKHMINSQSIAKMKPTVRIINAARGALVNEAELAQAVKDGKVAGAGIDVYNEEPPEKGNPLVGLAGVIHTPHLGASTVEAQDEVAVQIAQQTLDALIKGEYRNVVNPDVLKKVGQKA